MCDTGGDAIAIAHLRRDRLGRRLIVFAPYEWRHDLYDAGLDMDEQRRVEAAVRQHLDGTAAAATWSISRKKLQIVHGRQVHWRKT